jgi:hypothetical protein
MDGLATPHVSRLAFSVACVFFVYAQFQKRFYSIQNESTETTMR